MMKSDYQWNDKELKEFYFSTATRKPSEQNRSRGGIYFRKTITPIEIFKGEDGLNILYAYQCRFEDANLWKHAMVLKKVIQGCKMEILRTRKVLFIPNREAGELLASGVLKRELRTILKAFESILDGKPNETAKYYFAGV